MVLKNRKRMYDATDTFCTGGDKDDDDNDVCGIYYDNGAVDDTAGR